MLIQKPTMSLILAHSAEQRGLLSSHEKIVSFRRSLSEEMESKLHESEEEREEGRRKQESILLNI
jgi:hypothetical protein